MSAGWNSTLYTGRLRGLWRRAQESPPDALFDREATNLDYYGNVRRKRGGTQHLHATPAAGRIHAIHDARFRNGTTEVLLAAVPDDRIEFTPPERNRTLRDLGHHVFRLSLAFVDGMDQGEFPGWWLQDPPPPGCRTGGDVARYGALVRARLQGWFAGTGPDEYARIVNVYYGPQSGHDLLERTTWHAGQHLRQLYDLADRIGVAPPRPIPASALEGLPLPASLW